MSLTPGEAHEQATAQLAAWRRSQAPATPLHSIAEAGAGVVVAQHWQAGLDEAVRTATDAAHRKGLGGRETRRAAARAANAYLQKHPRP